MGGEFQTKYLSVGALDIDPEFIIKDKYTTHPQKRVCFCESKAAPRTEPECTTST